MSGLEELTNGNSLKSHIFKAIASLKPAATNKYPIRREIKHQQEPQPPNRCLEIGSPKIKTDSSVKKIVSSPGQESQEKRDADISKSKKKNCSYERTKTAKLSPDKKKSLVKSSYLMTCPSQSTEDQVQKPKNRVIKASKTSKSKQKQTAKVNKSRSKEKTNDRMFLSSIMERSSSDEMLITPSNKRSNQLEENYESRTKKKQKPTLISETYKKKILNSFEEPQKFQHILKCEAIRVSYRILKKRIIQIQLYTLRNINTLSVTLQKGSIQCQNIHEEYNKIASNTVLSLFTSIREINIFSSLDFPKIILQIDVGDDQHKFRREVTVPYTWLHFIEQTKPQKPKKGKIKTKISIQDLPTHPKTFKTLNEIFHNWSKRELKDIYDYQTHFTLQQQHFLLKLHEHSKQFDLELEGRGEQQLTKMIEFLTALLS